MKSPYEHFLHCPRCGHPQAAPPAAPVFTCSDCAFTLYFNPASAAAAFLTTPDARILFIRRAKEPALGKLAIPGGFIDYHERAEDALRREILEEVGLTVGPLQFLCSQVNHYDYRDVRYPVVDLFFASRLPASAASEVRALDGVAEVVWLRPAQVDPEDLAFPSIRAAFQILLEPRPPEPPSVFAL